MMRRNKYELLVLQYQPLLQKSNRMVAAFLSLMYLQPFPVLLVNKNHCDQE